MYCPKEIKEQPPASLSCGAGSGNCAPRAADGAEADAVGEGARGRQRGALAGSGCARGRRRPFDAYVFDISTENHSTRTCSINAYTQPEEEQKGVHGGGGVAGAQVEAALNHKNVEALPEDETVEGGPEDAWVPDHETGVFVPADKAAVSGTENHDHCGAAAAAGGSPSVLD
ncbi:Os03g0627000 [Oryza sativa Japonica Group]|uniref:Os03g0627000 protein n=1 Tax=Oryza sativa subsp. japonica TaxID=39947 RepID=A0A0P0W0F4_ORYSJ|nr:Os03g0627000 [Oryza sativa Japonica Group]